MTSQTPLSKTRENEEIYFHFLIERGSGEILVRVDESLIYQRLTC